ncbi:Formamidopyrimidine-DNA glycosylase [Dirofilaria immitis]
MKKGFSGQFVEKKVRAISMRNPRLGLIVQKKISDCVFEASMELLEIDHPEVAQNNHVNYNVN